MRRPGSPGRLPADKEDSMNELKEINLMIKDLLREVSDLKIIMEIHCGKLSVSDERMEREILSAQARMISRRLPGLSESISSVRGNHHGI